MTSWNEVRSTNMERAQLILKKYPNPEELRAWVSQWIDGIKDVSGETYPTICTHPATVELADRFRDVGLSQVSAYLQSFDQRDGPIHQGKWLFAILLGQACANLAVTALIKGEQCDDFPFWGHEECGSREIFIAELQSILTSDNLAQQGMWAELDKIIAETNHSPEKFFMERHKTGFIRSINNFKTNPTLKEAWETSLDSYIWFGHSFVFTIACQIDARLFFEKLKNLPHPVFLKGAFHSTNTIPENSLSEFIAVAPAAFDENEIFHHSGMIMLHLLSEAANRIRHLAGKSVWKHPFAPSDEEEMKNAGEAVANAIKIILDSLFSRSDAEFLAWAWLERLIFEGTSRGLWYPNFAVRADGNYSFIDTLSLLIAGLAQHLRPRTDVQKWVLQQESLWQKDRIFAALAVTALQQEPDKQGIECAIREALLTITPDFYGADKAIEQPNNLIGRIGGRCILLVEQPHLFVEALWQELRPFRERSWHHRREGDSSPNIGKLFTIWCIFAIEESSGETQRKLIRSVRKILRDASQIDVFFGETAFWASAVNRFAQSYGESHGEIRFNSDEYLAEFIYAYLDDSEFIVPILVSLNKAGIPVEQLDGILKRYGLGVTSIVDSFLNEQHRLISKGHYNRAWLKRVEALSDALKEQPERPPASSET